MTLEERFWAKVWRCTHRWPCKKCCWPWRKIDLALWGFGVWKYHPAFFDARLQPRQQMAASRVAYLLTHATFLLPGIIVCHQCHFAPCCNPSHLQAGTQGDNGRDSRGKGERGEGYPLVLLPNGKRLWPEQPDVLEVSMDALLGRKMAVKAA